MSLEYDKADEPAMQKLHKTAALLANTHRTELGHLDVHKIIEHSVIIFCNEKVPRKKELLTSLIALALIQLDQEDLNKRFTPLIEQIIAMREKKDKPIQ